MTARRIDLGDPNLPFVTLGTGSKGASVGSLVVDASFGTVTIGERTYRVFLDEPSEEWTCPGEDMETGERVLFSWGWR